MAWWHLPAQIAEANRKLDAIIANTGRMSASITSSGPLEAICARCHRAISSWAMEPDGPVCNVCHPVHRLMP